MSTTVLGPSRTNSRRSQLIETCTILFLFFHTLWHLIAYERSSLSVFLSFFLLGVVFIYSSIKNWAGWKVWGVRRDNLATSFKAALWPLLGFALFCVVVLLVKQKPGRWPGPREFFTFFLWGTFQQWIIQSFFLLRYEAICRNRLLAIGLTAVTFSLFHLPNIDLMMITFAGCLYLSYFFYRWRNLISVGFLHGMISLLLVVTLKYAHAISDNYRVGPNSMMPLTLALKPYMTQDAKVLEWIYSGVPKSFFREFERNYFDGDSKVGMFGEIEDEFQSSDPRYLVMTEDEFEALKEEKPGMQMYEWGRYQIWKRDMEGEKLEVLASVFTLNTKRLDDLYRKRMVFISNQPRPESF